MTSSTTSSSTANLSLDIHGYNFANIGISPKIYINNTELNTKKRATIESALFTDLYGEYKDDTSNSKFDILKAKLDDTTTGFIASPITDSYAVHIQLQIVKNPINTSDTPIPVKEAVIIEFEPYKIERLTTTPAGGGRRRTKISKRHSTYRTRKNKK